MKAAIVCEAESDFITASELVDRVVCESVDWMEPEWLESCRSYVGVDANRQWVSWASIAKRALNLGIRVRGHFSGEPGEHDAHAARRAINVVLLTQPDVDVIILVRDDDGDFSRRSGLEQGRKESRFRERIIIGLAARKRECWVLAGFVPQNAREESLLSELRRELGFNPCTSPEMLTARASPQDLRNAKRVLEKLTGGIWQRECDCWRSTALTTIRQQGSGTGIGEFLDEVEAILLPLLAR